MILYMEEMLSFPCIYAIHIKQILKNFETTLKQILKFLEVNKKNYDTNEIKL